MYSYLRKLADHPLLWPVKPIVRTLIELIPLYRGCKFCMALLALASGLLFIGSYYLTKTLESSIHKVVADLFEDTIKQEIGFQFGKALTGLFISNSAFFLFRFVLAKALYAAYELGRDRCFAILIVLFIGLSAAAGLLHFQYPDATGQLLFLRKIVFGGALAMWIALIWFWRRYVFRGRERKIVFDHEVGAALVRARSG